VVNCEFYKDTLDIIIPLVSGLLGTIIGGLITYFSVRASDNRKWEQAKIDRLSSEHQEAIAMALEWCEPFRKNILKARLLTGSFLQQWLELDELRSQWPNLLENLAQQNLPAKLQVWLPPDTYQKALHIAAKLNNFISNIDPFPLKTEEWRERFNQYSIFFNGLNEELEVLEMELSKAYKQSFE